MQPYAVSKPLSNHTLLRDAIRMSYSASIDILLKEAIRLSDAVSQDSDVCSALLSARCVWALERVSAVCGDAQYDESFIAQIAKDMVVAAARTGREKSDDLTMIDDVPELLEAWGRGLRDGLETEAAELEDDTALWTGVRTELNRKLEEAESWLSAVSKEAGRRCGLSDTLYVQFFSEEVDAGLRTFAEEDRAAVMALAIESGYLTRQQRVDVREQLADDGYCSHGLDPNCCPVGCGDLE